MSETLRRSPASARTWRFARRPTAWARLIRVENCVAAAALTLVGMRLGGGVIDAGCAAAACAAVLHAAGNSLNDRCDVAVDRLARPDRPLPSGLISMRAAELCYGGSTVLGVAFAFVLGPMPGAIAIVVVLLTAAYCTRLKNSVLLGNVTVAWLAALTVPFGAIASNGQLTWTCWLAALLVASYMTAFEILKCLQDRTADTAVGIRTIATVLPARVCARLAVGLLTIFCALALLGIPESPPLAYPISLAAPLSCLAVAGVLVLRDPLASVRSALGWLKVGWFAGLPALILLA